MDTDIERESMTDTSIRVSEELADELYQRKGRSTSYEDYIWELLEQVEEEKGNEDIAESDSSEGSAESVRESDQTANERVYEDLAEPVESDEEAQAAEDALRSLNLPGKGVKYEMRVQAVLAFYKSLHDHPGEPMGKGDFEDLVEERDLDVGYSSFTSLWNNWVKSNASQGRDVNTLAQLPGVEMEGDDYVYTGENNE